MVVPITLIIRKNRFFEFTAEKTERNFNASVVCFEMSGIREII